MSLLGKLMDTMRLSSEDDEDDYVSIPYRKGRNYKYAPEEKTK